jgi:hypothetical protein
MRRAISSGTGKQTTAEYGVSTAIIEDKKLGADERIHGREMNGNVQVLLR